MNKKELQEKVKSFERTGKTSDDLNVVRKAIFDAYDEEGITEKGKNSLLKDLYFAASIKGIIFFRIMERNTSDLPKNEEEELKRLQEEEDESYDSYEESYSYDDDDEEDK